MRRPEMGFDPFEKEKSSIVPPEEPSNTNTESDKAIAAEAFATPVEKALSGLDDAISEAEEAKSLKEAIDSLDETIGFHDDTEQEQQAA